MPTDKRIFGLDLLRCTAILLVLITHTINLVDPKNHGNISVYTGYFGVEFFFVLSGFLIGTILLKINQQPPAIDFKGVRIFWIRRWFRTLPNYYLMFLVYALLLFASHHLNVFRDVNYLSYLVFLQNSVSYQPNNFFPIAWSLSIEEWFYLLFPLVLFAMTKLFTKNRSRPFLITIFVIMGIELVARAYTAIFLNNYWDEGFRKLMPLRLDSIDIGVLAAYIKFYRPASWKRNPKKLALGGALLLAALTVYFGFAYARHYDAVNWDHFFKAGLFLETLFFTLISLSIAMLFPWLCSLSVKAGYFSRAVTFVSLISYSIYLTHFAIIIVVAYVFKHYTHLWYVNVLMFVIIWVATMFVSAVQYNYFEVKMTALRNKISRKQAAIKI